MKRKTIFMAGLLLLTGTHRSNSQNTDAIWYFGDSAGISFQSGSAVALGNGMSFSAEANSNICDSQGNLLFCAGFNMNGDFYVWNGNHSVMKNSASITVDVSQTNTQGLLILPFPGDSTRYYLFTQWPHFMMTYQGKDLSYHIIDMAGDSGRGEVITANINICSPCTLAEKMIGIRHANGRDWWLLGAECLNPLTGTTGHFIRWLITPSGISPPDTQSIGPGNEYIGQMSISFGNKLITAEHATRQLDLYDFDRCTGLLSNRVELGFPPYVITTPINGFYGCSFSPSGRYLYASRLDSVFQFDVLASNVYASKVFLGKEGHVGQYWLGQHKLGLDGKIYFPSCDWQGGAQLGWEKFLNVINYPDSAGTACGLAFHSFYLGDRSALWGMPNIPDFNLGSVPGSLCDSLTGVPDRTDSKLFDFNPNPTKEHLHFVFNNYLPGPSRITISNLLGQTVLEKTYTALQKPVGLDVTSLPAGIYLLSFTQDNVSLVKKFVKVNP